MKRVQPTLFPVAWLDESIEVDDETIGKLKAAIMIMKIAFVVPLVCFSLAALMALITCSIIVFQLLNKS